MSVPVGITVPKLLPITGTWAAPFAIYGTILSWRVVSERLRTDHYIGDKPSSTEPTTDPTTLQLTTRSQANFLENVPLAFLFLTIAELNGGNRKYLNYAMATLLALRVAHAEGGLMLKGKYGGGGMGRPVGYFGTNGVLLGLSGYAAWLVRGYWGF